MNKTKENKFKKWFNSISFAILPFCVFLVLQMLAWGGNQLIYTPGVNHPWTALDKYIPIVSWFIWFYYLTFPVGIVSYFYCASVNKKRTFNVIVTVWIMTFISGLFYYFYPTEMIKPIDTYPIKSLSDRMMVNTWQTGNPNCCFPSGHCMMAIGSFLCVYNQKDMKWWAKIAVMFSAVMTVLATVFLKQHYIADFYATFCIMVPTYIIVCLCKVGDKMTNKYCKEVFSGVPNTKTDTSIEKIRIIQEDSNIQKADLAIESPVESENNVDIIKSEKKIKLPRDFKDQENVNNVDASIDKLDASNIENNKDKNDKNNENDNK